MTSGGGHVRAILFVGVGLALAACDRAPPPVHEAVTPMHSVPQGDMCPDITGTFAFEPRSVAARFLVGARRLNQGY